MDIKDFDQRKTGRFVPTIMGHPAFVPDPLSKLELPLAWPLINLLSEADAAVAQVAGACSRQINPALVLRPFQRQEAILSSRIEGTITTAKELAVLEAKPEREDSPASDTKEVRNYLAALDQGLLRLAKVPLSLGLIRELHATLMKGVRGEDNRPGEFRQHQAAIGKTGQTEKEARFVPPPPKEMLECLYDFEKFIHTDKYPPLLKMAVVHYQFETIHPFGDGNGRTGRLLIPLMMLAERRMDNPVLYLSAYFEANDAAYRDHLLSISQHGSWSEWIMFFLRGVIAQSRATTKRLGELDVLLDSYCKKVMKAPGPLQQIIEDLFTLPVVSAESISKKYSVSHQTAMNYIRRLEKETILDDSIKNGREMMFVATALL